MDFLFLGGIALFWLLISAMVVGCDHLAVGNVKERS